MTGENSKIRIAYLIDTIACDTAGTQKQLLETIKRLDSRKFIPHLICLWESAWMRQNDLPCATTVLGYRGFIKPNFWRVIKQFTELIALHRFHIIQTFFEDSIFVAFIAGVLSRPQPVLLSSRRDMGLGVANQPWYHHLFSMALPLVNKKFAGIVTNSANVGTYVCAKEKVPAGKIKVIHNGIDIPARTDDVPQIFKDHPGDLWVGIVASLTPVKRHDVLLQAMALAGHSGPGGKVRLLLLGDGPEREKLHALAEQLEINDNVHFAGAVKNVSAYLYQLDVGVLCSDREGLSNAILEYMACGLPTVVTAVGGNVELVEDSNGLCVPPDDPEAMAEALDRLIGDTHLRARLGKGARQKIEQTFSWQRAMEELETYYHDLVLEKCTWAREEA